MQLPGVLACHAVPVLPEGRQGRGKVPLLSVADLLQESFHMISIDGAGNHFSWCDVRVAPWPFLGVAAMAFAANCAGLSQWLLGVSNKAMVLSRVHDELHRIADQAQKPARQHPDARVNSVRGIYSAQLAFFILPISKIPLAIESRGHQNRVNIGNAKTSRAGWEGCRE